MKNKITCLLAGAALFGATANAEIVLAEGLSASGYIDMVASDYDNAERDTDLVEYELGLTFAPVGSQWSAVAELAYDEGVSSFETVAVTYQYSDALSFSFGNIYTYQGLESHDAPNNSFITYAGMARDGVDIIDSDLYSANFAEGISADYSAGDFSFGVWAGDTNGGEDFEYFASYNGIENLTLAVAVADNNDGSETTNLMATYEYDAFTLSVEDVVSEDGTTNDLEVTSVAAAYNMGDTTVAVRVVDGEIAGEDYENTSIAAFQALSDNVSAGIEYSDGELGTDEVSGFAVELLYVF